jgi:hypothetical protein
LALVILDTCFDTEATEGPVGLLVWFNAMRVRINVGHYREFGLFHCLNFHLIISLCYWNWRSQRDGFTCHISILWCIISCRIFTNFLKILIRTYL